MKHLKKLSVAIMMVTLFSGTFTSCIDNEVSPLVEAIYEAQADLIAAQAGVQNAEAALLLAQANAEEAQAAYTNAQAAQQAAITAGIVANNSYEATVRVETLRALVASTNAQVAASQNAMALAQAQFNATMAALTAQMQAAGATLAVGYANQFTAQMAIVNSLKAAKLAKEGELAVAELYLKAGSPETTWTLYLADLNAKLAAEQAKVTAAEAAIVTLNTAKANNATETQIAGLKAQRTTLEARKVALIGLIATAEQNRLAAQKAITDATAFMSGTYATTKASLDTWKATYAVDSLAVKTQTANVALHTNAIANYAATYTTLKGGVNDALSTIGWKAMTTDALVIANPYVGAATSPATGLLKDIADVNVALGTYGTAPVYVYGGMSNDVPRTGAAALTAYGKLWNADLALLKFETDFAQLTASYNLAASNLATLQAAFDGSTFAADLATANTNYNTALTARNTAQTTYNVAKTAFEADPTGSVNVDGPIGAVTDLGQLGIKTDASLVTYMRVATWTETSVGSGLYIPATFTGTKYNLTDLALEVTALKAAALPTDINTDADITLWQQDGTNTDYAGVVGAVKTSLTGTEAQDATAVIGNPTITQAYFVNVESDDSSVSKLATFNIATNKLGTNNFSNKWFTSDGKPYKPTGIGANIWNPALLVSDPDAGYLSTWNGLGIMGAADTLTAQAVLWNMALELAKKQYAFDNGSVALDEAKEEFAYQKSLFDTGLATRVTLTAAVDAAELVIGEDSTPGPASGLLGDKELLEAKLGSTNFLTKSLSDAKLTTSSADAFYTVGTVKTLTAYAALFNARKDFNALVSVTLAQHQTMLATAKAALTVATNKVAEDLIYIAKYTADLAALQAQYDALISTSPTFAALNVTLINATQAKAALEAEDTAATISITSLNNLISALQVTVPDYTGLIAAENLKISNAKAIILATQIAISQGGVTLAGLQANVQVLKDQIAALTIQIANAQALADKYKALMNAALAS